MEVIRIGGLYNLGLKPPYGLYILFIGFEFIKVYLRFQI
jgi:hypothetical protein